MSSITFKISKTREYDARWFGDVDQALTPLGGCSDSGSELGLGTWQYELDVEVKNQNGVESAFTVVFQPEERTNGMKAYSGYDVATCGEADNDQSNALFKFCDWDQGLIDALYAEAKSAAKAEYERLMADHEDDE